MRNKRVGLAIVLAGAAIILGSAAFLVLTAGGEVRYSADHGDTVPFWRRWLPALAGILLIRLLPAGPTASPTPAEAGGGSRRWVDALVLTGAALAFLGALLLIEAREPAATLIKLFLLLAVPLVSLRRRPLVVHAVGARWVPAVPVAAWLLLTYFGPLARPAEPFTDDLVVLIGALVVGFAVNSLLEEWFYRRWLQTRWEPLVGPWAAIMLSALLWAVWHVAIQGGDLAVVVASHAVTGLFLGFLWMRYRRMWPLLTVHGALNAAPALLALL